MIQNFVKDFPLRCNDVLTKYQGKAELDEREVTLLLMAATAGFVIPYERMDRKSNIPHPEHDYEIKRTSLDILMERKFFGSDLWKSEWSEETSWKGGELKTLMRDAEDYPKYKDRAKWTQATFWEELSEPEPVDPSVRVCYVLECLRNALAHGNIYTKPASTSNRRIGYLIFATGTGKKNTEPGCWCRKDEKGSPFRFVQVSIADFREFLANWFAWTQHLVVDEKFIYQGEDGFPLQPNS